MSKQTKFLGVSINVRLNEAEYERARDTWEKNQNLYDNLSHYIRAAIIRLNNHHEKKKLPSWMKQ